MAELAAQARSRPRSDRENSLEPAGKKPRLDEDKDIPVELPEVQNAHPEPPKKLSKKQRGKEKRKNKRKHTLPEPYSPDDVLWRDVVALLGKEPVDDILEAETEWDSPFEFQEEVELVVSSLSSNGESLSIAPSPKPPWVVVTPFALPGEHIRARIYRNSRLHSFADLVAVLTPNPELRDMGRVQCRYFGECAGCQYQMLSYEMQLDLKRNVVVKAYQNFSGLDPSSVPPILPTIASPLQYGYRTKITPHFEAPPKKLQKQWQENGNQAESAEKPDWLKIGFNKIGTRKTIDIEECPIATPVLNQALGPLREGIIKNIYSYKKGVSLLLRDSLEVNPDASSNSEVDALAESIEKHVCITNHKATVRERVGDKIFEYPGGSFFQNNNSVLVPLTTYVRDAIFPAASLSSAPEKPTHLVDAYCGSGLFAITLSDHFAKVAGIELSADSIRSATRNAQLNGIPADKITFRAGDAADIFASVQDFPPEHTVVVIDPPRKGTDEKFVDQLMQFGGAAVVYVSCNVHTQARDVGMILGKRTKGGGRYVLESLRGFDLFPQTAHVESVAVLRLVDTTSESG
ncbi:S-adenosyl-L-methionine-dependent methyltransferase [Gloeophyllum trabeum ATCC 11539]|uniref:S-adenosyl-L-methionine-dependent methyltransferase n=1 Tax=Gloeophyllum trabeum (strain ATCC 11539 / FP-39264 / Madison 617) TaxID=670483 RepID=S7S1F3_GLOTA|nr:S-adenosyl-L-methionine-dependent methyltransferase [Gloeophyllum trabeum ATCC 11539]EPQ61280.1 S-adenosyl-L-methionine-dependent methyltransferase [Gloeophyllum trabeum ATCC 11539]